MKKIGASFLVALLVIGGIAGGYYWFTQHSGKKNTAETFETTTESGETVTLEKAGKEYEKEVIYDEEEQLIVTSREETELLENQGTRKFIKTIRLDVPFENQMAGKPLENGGGITALSMLLNYYRLGTNKNELAQQLAIVPFEKDGLNGNPTKAFVGNLEKGKALGVYAAPLANITHNIVGESYQVMAGNQLSFEDVLEKVQKNHPVWIAVSRDLQIPDEHDNQLIQTTEGTLTVPQYIHAVVIVGMDQYRVYVNDPLGEEEKEIKLNELKEIYEKMGSQSLYLNKK